MCTLKKTATIRKIAILIYIIINCVLLFFNDMVFNSLLSLFNFSVMFYIAEEDKVFMILFFIIELIAIMLIFYNKNFKIKLVSNCIIQFFCAIDIILQIRGIYYIALSNSLSNDIFECIVGIIIDSIFWFLIFYDIFMTSKEQKHI